jgi:hypothetical protein
MPLWGTRKRKSSNTQGILFKEGDIVKRGEKAEEKA